MTPIEAQEAQAKEPGPESVAGAASNQKTAKIQAGAAGSVVQDYFKDIPIMARIAWCESKYRHTDPQSGQIIRGFVNRNDIGIMQINETYHGKAAQALGIDIYSLDGNLRYARYLYDKEGTRPWASSERCWGGDATIAQK